MLRIYYPYPTALLYLFREAREAEKYSRGNEEARAARLAVNAYAV